MDMSSPRMHAAGPFLGRLASASDSRKIGLPLKRPVGPHRMERSRVVRDGAWCAPRKRLDLGHRAPTPSPPYPQARARRMMRRPRRAFFPGWWFISRFGQTSAINAIGSLEGTTRTNEARGRDAYGSGLIEREKSRKLWRRVTNF